VLIAANSFSVDRGVVTSVCVEVDVRAGLPALTVIGLGSGSGRDLRERVQAAVLNSGFGLPRRRVTVNVAPAARKGGPEFDLAVACCLLSSAGAVDPKLLARVGLWAELGLGGELRGVPGAVAVAEAVSNQADLVGLLLAPADLDDASAVTGARVVAARTLCEVCALLAAPSRALERALTAAGGPRVPAPG
jgi:magnesium chelatase family protein